MIIGGGPGGMEAALTASSRGHRVSLYEKEDALGGQLPIAAAQRDRRPFLRFRNYLVNEVKKQGIDVHLGAKMDPEKIIDSKPDVVVVALRVDPDDLDREVRGLPTVGGRRPDARLASDLIADDHVEITVAVDIQNAHTVVLAVCGTQWMG